MSSNSSEQKQKETQEREELNELMVIDDYYIAEGKFVFT
jgi:hypothetical protein